MESVTREPILSAEQLTLMYPKASYGKGPHGSTFILHYLGALGQPLSVASNYLSGVETKKGRAAVAEKLTKCDFEHECLSPLMLAIASGKGDFARYLLEAAEQYGCLKECLEQRDTNGFTVLHHAALSAPEFVTKLLHLGADASATTPSGFTYGHLQQLTNPDLAPCSSRKLFWQEGDGESIAYSDLSSEQKDRIGITRYRDVNLFDDAKARRALWMSNPVELDQRIQKIYGSSAKTWCANPPRLTLKVCPELGSNQLGLYAAQRLNSNAIVGPYAGESYSPTPPGTLEARVRRYQAGLLPGYRYSEGTHVDGENTSNAISRANVGWPNAIIMPASIKGLPPGNTLLVADSQGIKPGEEIRWGYGLGMIELALCDQKLLGRDKMRAFFANGLANVMRVTTRSRGNELTFVRNTLPLYTALGYAISTPKALIDLHLSGLVKAAEWLELSTFARLGTVRDPFLQTTVNQHPSEARTIRAVLVTLDALEKRLKDSPVELRATISDWALGQLDSRWTTHVIKGLCDITKALDEGTLTLASWPVFAEQLDTTLNAYDWFQDEASPLHTGNDVGLFLDYIGEILGRDELKKQIVQNLQVLLQGNPATLDDDPLFTCLVSKGQEIGMPLEYLQAAIAQFRQQR